MKTVAPKKRDSSIRILSLPGKDFGANPYINLFCESLEKAGMLVINIHTDQAKYFGFDVLHLHWPEFYVTEKPVYVAMVLAPTVLIYIVVSKLLRKKIVWTVHDVMPVKARHARLLQLYLLCVRVLIDAYVFMSPSSRAKFVKIFPRAGKKTAWYVPHGRYPVAAISPQRRAELRKQ